MVGNDWVNSYLEAILAAEPGIGDSKYSDSKSSLLLRERGHFSPTRYFVEEVITGFDETDLHRSWIQVYTYTTLSSHPSLLIFFFTFIVGLVLHRLLQLEVRRRGTRGLRISAGGFGISLARRSRLIMIVVSIFLIICFCELC